MRLSFVRVPEQRSRTKREAEVGSKTIPEGLLSGLGVRTRPRC
jgi:hypothetical protein